MLLGIARSWNIVINSTKNWRIYWNVSLCASWNHSLETIASSTEIRIYDLTFYRHVDFRNNWNTINSNRWSHAVMRLHMLPFNFYEGRWCKLGWMISLVGIYAYECKTGLLDTFINFQTLKVQQNFFVESASVAVAVDQTLIICFCRSSSFDNDLYFAVFH